MSKITNVEYDDRDILCFEFDNQEWIPITYYKFVTEEQRRLIEEHPRFDGWESEPPDSDEESEESDEESEVDLDEESEVDLDEESEVDLDESDEESD